jgi:hypothetical protein
MLDNKLFKGGTDITEPKDDNVFLWKYFDIHRFIYLITEQKLFFTRLDKFDDPFEGISTSFLRREALFSTMQFRENHSIIISPEEQDKDIDTQFKVHEYLKKSNLHNKQNRQYVNCWFTCERESMAMWNIYSNPDSVAVKLDFKKYKEKLIESFDKFISKNGYRLSIIGDEITYLKLNPFDISTEKQKLKYSAMKKDVSFAYEKEFRFLIYTNDLDKKPISFQIPLDLNEFELTVITHPNMENWKVLNIRKLIKLCNLNITVVKSSTMLRTKNHV